MKLKNIRELGRFENTDGKAVNVKVGRQVGRSVDLLYYLYRGKRVFISDHEFYSKEWTKIS